MNSTGVLDNSTLRNFVGPGTKLSLLERLFKVQINIRLMQLAQVQRKLNHLAPVLAAETGFNNAYSLLKQLPQKLLYRIAGYPSFGQWCAAASYLLSSEEHFSSPSDSLAKHLFLLGNYALVGALVNGSETTITLLLDQQASAPLPTLNCALIAPPELANTILQCQVRGAFKLIFNDDNLPVCFDLSQSSPQREASQKGFWLRWNTTLAGRFELNDCDPLLRSQIEQDFETLDEFSRQRWRRSFGLAIDLLQKIHPAYFTEIEHYISVIVPLVNTTNTTYVSSTTRTMFGMIQLSWPDQESLLAEGLIHEYHHNKLNALMDITPLINDPSNEARYYSPWRSDPRPIYGLLHGIFAFQSVSQFWHTYITYRPTLPDADEGARQYASRKYQSLFGIELIQQHDKLTKAGEIIIDEIQCQLKNLPKPPISSIERKRIKDQMATHQKKWEQANSHLL